jgi:hypothetical protein
MFRRSSEVMLPTTDLFEGIVDLKITVDLCHHLSKCGANECDRMWRLDRTERYAEFCARIAEAERLTAILAASSTTPCDADFSLRSRARRIRAAP